MTKGVFLDLTPINARRRLTESYRFCGEEYEHKFHIDDRSLRTISPRATRDMASFLSQHTLAEIPILAAVTVASHVALSSPTPPPRNNEQKKYGSTPDPVTKMIQLGLPTVLEVSLCAVYPCIVPAKLRSVPRFSPCRRLYARR